MKKGFTFLRSKKANPLLQFSNSGFTLVELLVVITILAVLSVVGISAYSGLQKNARDARRKDDFRSIKVALELYYQNNKSYPLSGATLNSWLYSTGNDPWITGLSIYMPNGIPKDPVNTGNDPWSANSPGYKYAYWSSTYPTCSSYPAGQFFALVAQLENKNDKDRNEIKNYKWCDGSGLADPPYDFSDTSYVVTSF